MFAGFSDIFGGRSQSYRKQLASLQQEVVAELMLEGKRRGGNWVIGVRVDMDEISGQGKQMFMVTGIGTVYASLAGANGHVYVVGKNGKTVVVKAGDTFEIVATNTLDEQLSASPAMAGNELFLRGNRSLYCIAVE